MTSFPQEALDWMAVWSGVRGLVVGRDRTLPKRLSQRGHKIFALTPDEELLRQYQSIDNVTVLHACPEAIPLDPYQFEVIFCHQSFHTLQHNKALSEIARVIRPGGCLSISYLVRDDSVPWVRRLAALLRQYDPKAMQGNYGHDSASHLEGSHYFPETESRAFRVWQRISREHMREMVLRQPLANTLEPSQLDRLVEQVMALYDSAARPGEDLKLPFQLLCWRGWVDHAELSNPVELPDNALHIQV